jgi:radical SAM superfamily enzyme YgiQ (UPF0313 family)
MEKIQFTIICPAAKEFRVENGNKKPSKLMKVFRFSMLSVLNVAASAPPYVESRIVDENIEPIDFESITRDADVVGISFMTFNAPRAYLIADRLRLSGKTVIFGGYHPTLNPEEAAGHCDAVCVGDAEGNVPRIFEDFKNGGLKKFYNHPYEKFRSLPANESLLDQSEYIISSVLQATRGCTNGCGFCSISAFYKRTFKAKPVPEVIAEIRRMKGRNVLFIDDNLGADVEYAKSLFRALIPLKKHWYSQIGVNASKDPELLRLMRDSGCRGVFVGFESISQESLEETSKGFNQAQYYKDAIAKFHAHGIGVTGAFVIVFDHDKKDIIDSTCRFLKEAGVDVLQLTTMTPFPGTRLYTEMDRQKRIFDRNWEHYDLGHVVFQPRNFTPEELMDGHNHILGDFYSWGSIMTRLARQTRYLRAKELVLSLAISVGYRYKLKSLGYI